MRVWYVLMIILTGMFTLQSFLLGDSLMSYLPTLIMLFTFIALFVGAMMKSKKNKKEKEEGDDE